MAENKNTTLVVGVVALLLVGTTAFFVIKSIKKKGSQVEPEPLPPQPTPEKKKAQIFVGDTISAGIGQPNQQWDSVLKLGETVKNWLGGLGTKPVTFQTEGLAPITPTQIKNIDIKSELKKSLNAGYKTK